MRLSEDSSQSQLNQVYIDNDGFLHVTYHGHFNESAGDELYLKVMTIAEKLKNQGKSVKVLADKRDMYRHTTSSQRAGFLLRNNIAFEKMAIIFPKTNPSIRRISEILTSAFDYKEIKNFNSVAQARKWLIQN